MCVDDPSVRVGQNWNNTHANAVITHNSVNAT
jgi:hypothetical protein